MFPVSWRIRAPAFFFVFVLLAAPVSHLALAGHGGVHEEPLAPVPLAGQFVYEPQGAWLNGAFHYLDHEEHAVFDPVDGTWSRLSPHPNQPADATLVGGGGRLYLVGGSSFGVVEEGSCQDTWVGTGCRQVEAYDPATRTWSRVAQMPLPRTGVAAAMVGTQLYTVGGLGDPDGHTRVDSQSPGSSSWTRRADLPEGRFGGSLASLGNRVYHVGGFHFDFDTYATELTSTLFVYDPSSNTWTQGTDLPFPLGGAGVGTCDGRLLVAGGSTVGPFGTSPSDAILSYDPATGAWSHVGTLAGSIARGVLTAGPLTMLVGADVASALRCPVGAPAWGSGPDLVVTALGVSSTNPGQGDSIRLTATVYNRGTTLAGPFHVQFRDEERIVSTHLVLLLNAGASTTLTSASFTALGGVRDFSAWADIGGAVGEWNEDNNVRVDARYVRGPDLVPVALSFEPAEALPGEMVRLRANIQNVGDAAAGASATLVSSGSTSSQVATPALGVGAAADIWSAAFPLPSAPFHAVAWADWTELVHELDEENNRYAKTLRALTRNLVADALDVAPASPAHGDTVLLSGRVVNAGEASVPATVAHLRVDGELVAAVGVPALAPGQSADVGASWIAVGGGRVVDLLVDVENAVAETSEDDNRVALALHVRQADLVVDRLDVTPASVRPGGLATFEADVRNAGDAAAGPFVVRLTLDDGTVLASFEVAGLEAGASVTLTTDPKRMGAPGVRTVHAFADANENVDESDEGNNAFVRTFFVAF